MSAYDKQVGGSHYKNMEMQPSEFINKNKLLFAEGNAIKYICRHAHKGEVQDLEKAKHYIDMIIERDYETHTRPLPHGFTLTQTKNPDMTPMTEEEEYRNAGITKEDAERTYPPKNSWGMIKPPETSNADWIKGYKKWKKDCPHN